LRTIHKEIYMNRLSAILSAATMFASAALFAPSAYAQGHEHGQHASANAAAAMSSGEVIKVDKDTAKITIKHGPLANLNMPGMTMIFKVKDSSMLDQVKAGDKISFVAEKVDGALTVTKLEVAK
jgi:Cu(I)/Ag(I) efflux system protein CusF